MNTMCYFCPCSQSLAGIQRLVILKMECPSPRACSFAPCCGSSVLENNIHLLDTPNIIPNSFRDELL